MIDSLKALFEDEVLRWVVLVVISGWTLWLVFRTPSRMQQTRLKVWGWWHQDNPESNFKGLHVLNVSAIQIDVERVFGTDKRKETILVLQSTPRAQLNPQQSKRIDFGTVPNEPKFRDIEGVGIRLSGGTVQLWASMRQLRKATEAKPLLLKS